MERCNSLHNNRPFLCYDSARRLRRRGPCVRIYEAHAFWKYLTVRAALAKVWDDSHNVDLTNGTDFNWRGYLANHCDTWFETLFGEHAATSHTSNWRQRITKFEARLFCVNDGDGPDRSFAFIAHRADGILFKMQPGRDGATEGWPVVWHEANAQSSASSANPARANHALESRGTTGETDGQVFLHGRVQEWEHSMRVLGYAPAFTTNLTQEDAFAWISFLSRDDESRKMIAKGVSECWLVWVGHSYQRAGFYIRFHDNTEVVYAQTVCCKRWVNDERMVQDVFWRA